MYNHDNPCRVDVSIQPCPQTQHRFCQRLLVGAIGVGLLALGQSVVASADPPTCTWNTGDGAWSSPSGWAGCNGTFAGSSTGTGDNATVAGATVTLDVGSVNAGALGDGFHGNARDTFRFFNASSFLDFADAQNHFRCSGLAARLSYALSDLRDNLVLTLDTRVARAPEPDSLGMLGFGLLLLGGGVGWRRHGK